MTERLSARDDEFRRRFRESEAVVLKLIAYINHQHHARTCNRSFGDVDISLTWRDGVLKEARINEGHVIRGSDHTTLPGPSVVDTADGQA